MPSTSILMIVLVISNSTCKTDTPKKASARVLPATSHLKITVAQLLHAQHQMRARHKDVSSKLQLLLPKTRIVSTTDTPTTCIRMVVAKAGE